MNTPTTSQLERTKQDWMLIANEGVSVEFVKGTIYGFCSELAALRLAYKYRHSGDKAAAGYSENVKSWYFRLETNL